MRSKLTCSIASVGLLLSSVLPSSAHAMRRVHVRYPGGARVMEAAIEASWPASQHRAAKSVAWCESKGKAGAHRKGSQYRGIFQLGAEAWASFGAGNVFNPYDNAAAAHRMWRARGWSPWECQPA